MDEISERIVAAIVQDLTNRKGLWQAWDAIDEDIQDEIKAEWSEIVTRELSK